MKRGLSVPIFGVLFIILSVSIVVAQADACPELVKRALTAVNNYCDDLGRNEACYGNDRLKVELGDESPFGKPSDTVEIGDVRAIRTFGLDEENGTWGIVVMNVLANLPSTLPGQGVKFILYGDVALKNNAGSDLPDVAPMQAFYFTTNPFKPGCKEAPSDSLVIQSPEGYHVSLTADGMDLDIGSSVVLSAQRGKRMTMTTLQGKVTATYQGKQQVIPQGFEASVELGGDEGLTATEAPDTAYLLDPAEWEALADATDGLTETEITIPDTSEWGSMEDYCADPANATICADSNLEDTLTFEQCPDDLCPPLEEVPEDGRPEDTCQAVFCDAPPADATPDPNTSCENGSCDSSANPFGLKSEFIISLPESAKPLAVIMVDRSQGSPPSRLI